MKKEVLIGISGLQNEIGSKHTDEEPVQTLSGGNYFWKNGKHYLLFQEMTEGVKQVTKTQIKIHGDHHVEVQKRGLTNTYMVFDKEQKHQCYYETPFGKIHLGIETKNIEMKECEDHIFVKIEYVMDVDCEPYANCMIQIDVRPKDGTAAWDI